MRKYKQDPKWRHITAKLERVAHVTDCPAYYSNTAPCECEALSKPHCTNCDGAPDGGHTNSGDCKYASLSADKLGRKASEPDESRGAQAEDVGSDDLGDFEQACDFCGRPGLEPDMELVFIQTGYEEKKYHSDRPDEDVPVGYNLYRCDDCKDSNNTSPLVAPAGKPSPR